MTLTRTITRALAAGTALLGSAAVAFAQAVPADILPSNPGGVSGDVDFKDIISFAATYLLSIAGGIAVLFLVMGGIIYISAGGSDERVQKAKKYMQNAIIGLVVVVLAFVIVSNTLKVTYSLNKEATMSLTPNAATVALSTASPSFTLIVTCNNVPACPPLAYAVPSAGGNPIATLVAGNTVGNTTPYTITRSASAVGSGTLTFNDPASGAATAVTLINNP